MQSSHLVVMRRDKPFPAIQIPPEPQSQERGAVRQRQVLKVGELCDDAVAAIEVAEYGLEPTATRA